VPVYYFDIQDGGGMVRDTEGSEHRDLEAARREASDTLTQMGRDQFGSHFDHSISVNIRDGDGKALMRVTLTQETERF
jgi:hypothetical protein